MPKQATERTFTVEHRGNVIHITTDETTSEAFNAMLRTIFVAYRSQPAKLDAFMKLINAYHGAVKEKGRPKFAEPESDTEVLDFQFWQALMERPWEP